MSYAANYGKPTSNGPSSSKTPQVYAGIHVGGVSDCGLNTLEDAIYDRGARTKVKSNDMIVLTLTGLTQRDMERITDQTLERLDACRG